MLSKPQDIGDTIEAKCTKCRTLTNHIIIAMTDGKPVKVECNTCKGQHLYRAPKAPAPAKKPRATPRAKTSTQPDWAALRAAMNPEKAQSYSMEAEYKAGAWIEHPRFGLGQIQRTLGERKMEVLFEEGLKILRCK